MRFAVQQIENPKEVFKHHNVRELFSKDLVNQPELELDRLKKIFNLEQIVFETSIIKSNDAPLFQQVENYSELQANLESTKFSKMLE